LIFFFKFYFFKIFLFYFFNSFFGFLGIRQTKITAPIVFSLGGGCFWGVFERKKQGVMKSLDEKRPRKEKKK
jgi:hypothetical protein